MEPRSRQCGDTWKTTLRTLNALRRMAWRREWMLWVPPQCHMYLLPWNVDAGSDVRRASTPSSWSRWLRTITCATSRATWRPSETWSSSNTPWPCPRVSYHSRVHGKVCKLITGVSGSPDVLDSLNKAMSNLRSRDMINTIRKKWWNGKCLQENAAPALHASPLTSSLLTAAAAVLAVAVLHWEMTSPRHVCCEGWDVMTIRARCWRESESDRSKSQWRYFTTCFSLNLLVCLILYGCIVYMLSTRIYYRFYSYFSYRKRPFLHVLVDIFNVVHSNQ